MTIRVLLVDDQDLVRAGVRMILEAADDLDIIAEAIGVRQRGTVPSAPVT